MFIFLMSALCRPYFASKSSSKIASSNVFEHSRPMFSDSRRATLPALRCFITGGIELWQLMPDECDPLRAALDGLGVRHRVRGVGVAAPGGGDDVLLRLGDAGDRLPGRAVALEVRDEGGVDDVLLEAVQEDRRDEPAVLADLVEHRVRRLGEDDVLVDARELLGARGSGRRGTRPPRAPRPGSGGRPGCRRCSSCRRASSPPGPP